MLGREQVRAGATQPAFNISPSGRESIVSPFGIDRDLTGLDLIVGKICKNDLIRKVNAVGKARRTTVVL
jgi:hypothetical protein